MRRVNPWLLCSLGLVSVAAITVPEWVGMEFTSVQNELGKELDAWTSEEKFFNHVELESAVSEDEYPALRLKKSIPSDFDGSLLSIPERMYVSALDCASHEKSFLNLDNHDGEGYKLLTSDPLTALTFCLIELKQARLKTSKSNLVRVLPDLQQLMFLPAAQLAVHMYPTRFDSSLGNYISPAVELWNTSPLLTTVKHSLEAMVARLPHGFRYNEEEDFKDLVWAKLISEFSYVHNVLPNAFHLTGQQFRSHLALSPFLTSMLLVDMNAENHGKSPQFVKTEVESLFDPARIDIKLYSNTHSHSQAKSQNGNVKTLKSGTLLVSHSLNTKESLEDRWMPYLVLNTPTLPFLLFPVRDHALSFYLLGVEHNEEPSHTIISMQRPGTSLPPYLFQSDFRNVDKLNQQWAVEVPIRAHDSHHDWAMVLAAARAVLDFNTFCPDALEQSQKLILQPCEFQSLDKNVPLVAFIKEMVEVTRARAKLQRNVDKTTLPELQKSELKALAILNAALGETRELLDREIEEHVKRVRLQKLEQEKLEKEQKEEEYQQQQQQQQKQQQHDEVHHGINHNDVHAKHSHHGRNHEYSHKNTQQQRQEYDNRQRTANHPSREHSHQPTQRNALNEEYHEYQHRENGLLNDEGPGQHQHQHQSRNHHTYQYAMDPDEFSHQSKQSNPTSGSSNRISIFWWTVVGLGGVGAAMFMMFNYGRLKDNRSYDKRHMEDENFSDASLLSKASKVFASWLGDTPTPHNRIRRSTNI